MNEAIQAADDMLYVAGKTMRITVDAAVVVLRFSGRAAQQLAASLLAHLKSSSQKETGKISVRAMAKRGEPFDMAAIDPADAEKFQRLAKQTGLLYSIHADNPDYDKMQIDGLTTILYRQQDAQLVNSILQRCQINTLATMQAESFPDAASPDIAQTVSPAVWANQENTRETIPDMTYTYDTLQQQMKQNLSRNDISPEQLLHQHQDSGDDNPQKKKEPNREKQNDAKEHQENSQEQQGQTLLESQRQLEQQMRTNLKPPIHRDRSMEL